MLPRSGPFSKRCSATDQLCKMLPCLVLLSASCLPQILGLAGDRDARRCLNGSGQDLGSCDPADPAAARVRRTAGLLRSAAYLRLTPATRAGADSAQAQQLLSTASVPWPVPSTASTIAALAVTTECDPLQWGSRDCRCLPGYRWNDTLCKQLNACGGLLQAFASLVLAPSCQCLRWTLPAAGYCQPLLQASPVSKSSVLPPKLASVGAEGGLTLSFSLREGAAEEKWYLLRPEGGVAKEIRNGTRVTLLRSGSEAALSLSSVSPDWAGEYICRYWCEGSLEEVRQVVKVALGPADIVQTPSRVSMSCSSSALTLQCCLRKRPREVRASWSPGAPRPVVLTGDGGDPLCHFLTLDSCPGQDATYLCRFDSDDLGSAQAAVVVSVIQAGDLFCPSENSHGSWKATKAGQVAELLCPQDSHGQMLRPCSSKGAWGGIQSNCTRQELLSGLLRAQLLQAGLGSPQSEVPWMLDWLQMEVKPRQSQESNPWDLLTVVLTMETISEVALNAAMRLDGDAVANLLTAVSWLLTLDPETEWAEVRALWQPAGSRFLQAIEGLASLLLPSSDEFNLTLPNAELQSSSFKEALAADYSKAFDTEPPLRAHIAKEELDDLVRRELSITVTSLVLKKLEGVLPGKSDAESGHSLGSLVMSTAITSPNGSMRQVDIAMSFGHWNRTRTEEEGLVAQCVFWNHSLPGGMGGWSTEGCQASASAAGATLCTCHHLTAFSILMSAKPVPASFALTFLSKFGICASVLALVASLVIYYLVWTSVVKNKVSYFRYTTLVNIAFSLLMGNFWFLGATRLTVSHENKLCVAAAFFTHFSYLAMFCWMLVQALLLFHQLTFVFHQLTISAVTPAMVAVGYVCPLVIAVAAVATFLPKQGYVQAAVCWLSTRSRAIYAFSVPVLAIVMVNLLILFVVLLKLMRPSVSEGARGEERKVLLSIFKALLILTPVFGLTWGLGVVTMTTDASLFTHYAFSILNSLQGVFILLFGCLMDKKVRGALWKRLQKSPAPGTSTSQGKSDTLDSKLSN